MCPPKVLPSGSSRQLLSVPKEKGLGKKSFLLSCNHLGRKHDGCFEGFLVDGRMLLMMLCFGLVSSIAITFNFLKPS